MCLNTKEFFVEDKSVYALTIYWYFHLVERGTKDHFMGLETKLVIINRDICFITLVPYNLCLLYTSPSPRDRTRSRMPSSA